MLMHPQSTQSLLINVDEHDTGVPATAMIAFNEEHSSRLTDTMVCHSYDENNVFVKGSRIGVT